MLSGCKEIQLVRKKSLSGKSHQHLENLFRSVMDFESYKTTSFSFFQVSILLMQYKNEPCFSLFAIAVTVPMVWLCCISKRHCINLYLLSSPARFQPHLLVSPQLLDLFSWEDLMAKFIMLWTMSSSLLLYEPRTVKPMHAVYQNQHTAKSGVFPVNRKKKSLTDFLLKYPLQGLIFFFTLSCIFLFPILKI